MRALWRVCECGCGAAVAASRFANGHNARKHVHVYCGGELVRAYVHDGRGWCSRCLSWVEVAW